MSDICIQCGKELTKRTQKKFCDFACYGEHQKVQKIQCPECGKLCPKASSKTCSASCSFALKSRNNAKRAAFDGKSKNCSACHEQKTLSEFYPQLDGLGGCSARCKDCLSSILKEQRLANPERYERIKQKSREWYRNPSAKKWHQDWQRIQRRSDPVRYMLVRSKSRAKLTGMEHNIDISDIVIPETCPVLGIPLQVGRGKPEHGSPSLDRINNDLGYIKGNVCVISHRANSIKSDTTLVELEAVTEYVRMSLFSTRPQYPESQQVA